LRPGLYEQLLTEALGEQLEVLEAPLVATCEKLGEAEVADRVALHVGRILAQQLDAVADKERVKAAVSIARAVLELLARELDTNKSAADPLGDRPSECGERLVGIVAPRPDGTPGHVEMPVTPLLDTTLLTNAPREPRMGSQLLSEAPSADRIDVVMAFIRQSGIRPLLPALERHCATGRPLRVLTTTYTGSTEGAALERLAKLGAQVRVSYDTSSTRLHAKSWIFHRDSGFSTAYVGSSNLTYSANVTGLEWNVRASAARNPDLLRKVSAMFESYWNGGDFSIYDADEFSERTKTERRDGVRVYLSPVEIRLEPFQARMLEQIAVARDSGKRANLLVSATGTGKTVMAAMDYFELRKRLTRDRLLFVAHRKEILQQSMATFRHALRDPNFGELWVGGERPRDFDHVFASVQSLDATKLAHLDPEHFDVVIVDEFHHAAASSYRRLLDHLEPQQLLGLTATPERSDGLDILSYFGGEIAAEMRLWDAIDQYRLVPFAYYGVHDGLDLSKVPWKRGQGYEVEALSRLMTSTEVWARTVLQTLRDRVESVDDCRALGFCVSVDHARFMARVFNDASVPSEAVWGDSSASERAGALTRLREGKTKVLFSVDLFNEGVDLPRVDTLLMLRPTESPTLFLQQLGRGLRRAEGKHSCLVLDFVGTHREEFRFDRRLRALLGGSRQSVTQQVEQGFPYLPAGCHFELDRKSQEVVLRSLRKAIPSRWNEKVTELRRLAAEGEASSLADYLSASGLDLEDIYTTNKSWSDLREDAGLSVDPPGPDEAAMRRAPGRLLHVDDPERLATYAGFLSAPTAPDLETLSERERRLARMLVAQFGTKVFAKGTSLVEGWRQLWKHPQPRAETVELMQWLSRDPQHLTTALEGHPDVPLSIHARYSKLEIMGAFGDAAGRPHEAKVGAWMTGVRHLPAAGCDLLAFTLDKSDGAFSPTTRYRDYAISRDLIHWESQGVVRADSDTGQRYQRHAASGHQIFMFARLDNKDRAFWFLGPATYVSHVGERPMAVTWRLQYPVPGDLFAQFAAAVA